MRAACWRGMTAFATGFAMALAAASPLSAYVDHDRVLVVTAPSASDPQLKRQDAAVAEAAAGIGERDLVVIRAVGGEARDDRGRTLDAPAVRRAAELDAERFGVALVGKDGGVKLRRHAALPTSELFSTIDAMPMRRQEMKRRR